jgi:hypothetical protein
MLRSLSSQAFHLSRVVYHLAAFPFCVFAPLREIFSSRLFACIGGYFLRFLCLFAAIPLCVFV